MREVTGSETLPDQHLGSSNNREESAAFAMTSANGWTSVLVSSDMDDKPQAPSHN